MLRTLLFSLLLLFLLSDTTTAQYTPDTSRMYRIDHGDAYALFGFGLVTNIYGIRRVQEGEDTDLEIIRNLSPDRVNWFDRWIVQQDGQEVFERIRGGEGLRPRDYSDWGLIGGGVVPLLLGLDKKGRQQWFDILPMYLEAQVITANMWSWSPIGPAVVTRYRPFAYYDVFDIEERAGSGRRASWYSGHVASSAVGPFFAAKVYSDLHPEIGNRKWILYGAASLFPIWTGYWRLQDLAHFPSDLVVGAAVGVAVGVLVPHFHKKRRQKFGLSVIWEEDKKAAGMVMRF